jgi:small redox-active disulfide protein 2
MKETTMHTVKVLGSGCANCARLTALTAQALEELGRSEQVEKVTDYAQMAALGVMATPALAVDDQVVLAGRIPGLASLKETLAERLAVGQQQV